ncbi:MAG: S41 family peptidase [Bacteroidales bacterium]|nr:S41 family peptidase [Bacteroidales bacterium]
MLPPIKDTASYSETAPEVKLMEEGIVYILLPAHSGVKVSDSLYVHTVLDFLVAHQDAKGVVLDLRDNRGGNMYPMIAAVSPLLPDGIILRFKGRKRTVPVSLDFVLNTNGLKAEGIPEFPSSIPVALLTDDWTGSSGEATLLCFRGLENTRTFGIPTAGFASANNVKPLSDGYTLVITTGCDMARTGEVFCDDPISPDVVTQTPLEDALNWIATK